MTIPFFPNLTKPVEHALHTLGQRWAGVCSGSYPGRASDGALARPRDKVTVLLGATAISEHLKDTAEHARHTTPGAVVGGSARLTLWL